MNKLSSFAAASFVAAAVVSGLSGCNKSAAPAPEVSVEIGEVSPTSITFSVSAANAVDASYVLLSGEESVPAAEDILADGIALDLQEASGITADGLVPSTAYTVAVAVSSEDGQTASATATVTTAEDPALVFESAEGRHYGSNNWMISLNSIIGDIEYEIVLDLYDDESLEAGYVTDGIYTLSDGTSDGTVSKEYSYIDWYATDWSSQGQYKFESCTLDVKYTDGVYSLRLDAVLNDGSSFVAKYDGVVDGIPEV